MSEVVSAAAAGLAMLAVLIGGAVIAFTGNARVGLATAIDVLLAAGLLRLAVADDWPTIAAAAGILAVRSLLLFGLRSPRTPASGLGGDAM
jgi:hypothetical protein